MVDFSEAEAFYEKATKVAVQRPLLNSEIDFKTVDQGNHYDSMIEVGIPAGIEWIERQER